MTTALLSAARVAVGWLSTRHYAVSSTPRADHGVQRQAVEASNVQPLQALISQVYRQGVKNDSGDSSLRTTCPSAPIGGRAAVVRYWGCPERSN